MNFTFRAARDADASMIAEFNCRLAFETEGKALDPTIVSNGVLHGIQLAPEVRYFVAECDAQMIGQLMLTREWSDWRDGWMIWLQSVYVSAEFRRCGVFRSLYDYSIQTLQTEGRIAGVRLYVEHANEAAQSCYKSLGFRNAGYEVFEIDFTKTETSLDTQSHSLRAGAPGRTQQISFQKERSRGKKPTCQDEAE